MGISILPQHELIDLIETVSPDLAPEQAEILADKLRPALAPLDSTTSPPPPPSGLRPPLAAFQTCP